MRDYLGCSSLRPGGTFFIPAHKLGSIAGDRAKKDPLHGFTVTLKRDPCFTCTVSVERCRGLKDCKYKGV